MANRTRTDFLVIHCSATPPTADIGRDEIDQMHRERGFERIGYHFVIRRNGTIEGGREIEAVGAHARGFNSVSVGVCLVGGVDAENRPEANYSPAQWASLAGLVRELTKTYPNAEVLGHRDLGALKACPCFDARHWWDALRDLP